ncbi:MAG: hypothetical protein E6G19_02595 [Actinobacteria bacterium]|nr:MAG: hypothetical protein E6G19_02595 [Actinomycetota bacterium]
MRRLVLISMLAFALAVPAVGFALSGDNDGTLSVKSGVGKVSLNFNGSAVGRMQRGSIQLTDPIASDGLGPDFSGCEHKEFDKSTSTWLCRGTNLRFRAIGGKYQISIRGVGIYLSAVGEGSVILDGRGEDPNINSDGAYSLNDGPYKSLPDFGQTFKLSAPVGG